MKIFITGVAGFLGSHLADLMISEGHTVAGNDNMIGGYTDNVPQNVEFHQVDCCDLENMTKAMEGCDIVTILPQRHTKACQFSLRCLLREIYLKHQLQLLRRP